MTEETPRVQPWQLNAVIGLLALVVLLTAASVFQKWIDRQAAPKWEYAIRSVPDTSFVNTMNTLGADGWELVSARRATDDDLIRNPKPVFYYEIIFRRSTEWGRSGSLIKGP